jgi:hypothetical protein
MKIKDLRQCITEEYKPKNAATKPKPRKMQLNLEK